MKKFYIMLILFFICGFISADLCIEELQKNNVLLQLDVYKEYANAKLLFKDIFWNVLYERIKLFGGVVLLCFTPIRDKMFPFFLSIFSFVWGFFFMSSITELGVAGVVVALGAVLPHGLFYFGAIIMMLYERKRRAYHEKHRFIMRMGRFLFIVLLFITGCVMESLMSTHFIPWIIRLSLV